MRGHKNGILLAFWPAHNLQGAVGVCCYKPALFVSTRNPLRRIYPRILQRGTNGRTLQDEVVRLRHERSRWGLRWDYEPLLAHAPDCCCC
jgi:hypothetical protein